VLDAAIALYPRMEAFLQQDMGQQAALDDSKRGLASLFPADSATSP